jgi:hypothetical protein
LASLPNISILGDSRVFDTYYVNSDYRCIYGYDKTFPFLLRRQLLCSRQQTFDVVHIPDHFRAGTIENNIIRLALTNPAMVVLCDGIWETLVHKDWFIEYAVGEIKKHPTLSRETLKISYSSRILAELFVSNQLKISPHNYAERQRRIISYFARRRRRSVWMTLPVPPREHLNRLHFAGNHQCIPEWDMCLVAINDAVAPVAAAYDVITIDLNGLVKSNGGFGASLIDQWHFSPSFHALIAEELATIISRCGDDLILPESHMSHQFMLARPLDGQPVILWGDADTTDAWVDANPNANVEAVILTAEASGKYSQKRRRAELRDLNSLSAQIVIAASANPVDAATEAHLLKKLPQRTILVYPEELREIYNPIGNERASYNAE